MNNKKLIILLIMLIVGIILGYISSKVNDFIRYIILFPIILGGIGGYIYNLLLKKYSITSKKIKYIYSGIAILVITTFFSVNAFDYHQMKDFYMKDLGNIEEVKRESKNILNSIYEENYNIFKDIPIEESSESINNSLIKIKEAIDSDNYNNVIDEFILLYKEIGDITGESEDLEEIINSLYIIKENFNITNIENFFDEDLKIETGYGGYLGFQIFSFQVGETITTNGQNDIDTNVYGSIALYIIDLIAFIYGVIFSLGILKTLVCEIHNKGYKKYGNDIIYPTVLTNIDGDMNDIVNQLNTKHKKTGFFSNKIQNYINVSYYKCPACEISLKETKIEIKFSFYGKSKTKPLRGTVSKSFIILKDDYEKVNTVLELLTKEEIREIE